MVSYRGIDRDILIDSLQRGDAFLESLNLGPATRRRFDDWRQENICAQIAQAPDEEALARIMHVSKTKFLFDPYQEIFEFHALKDLQKTKTPSAATDLLATLQSWGAFQSGAMRYARMIIDDEIAFHRITGSARLLTPGALDETANPALRETLAALATGGKKTARALKTLAAAFLAAATDKAAKKLFDKTPEGSWQDLVPDNIKSYQRHELEAYLFAATGLPAYKDRLPENHAFQEYALIIPGFEKLDPASVSVLRNSLFNALTPYFNRDEANILGNYYEPPASGNGSQDFKKTGLWFFTTRRAAQAAANAFPEYAVRGPRGNRIPPAPRQDSPIPPETPSP